jgi:hypothetical protein
MMMIFAEKASSAHDEDKWLLDAHSSNPFQGQED